MVFESGYSDLPDSITPKFDLPDTPSLDSLVDLGAGASVITGSLGGGNPLCDKNLLKDIDGVMSLSTMPSVPNIEDILSASGLSSIPEKLDPEAMFAGIPTLTKLPQILGLPNWEKEAMAAADDVLNKLNIANPLDDLCAKIDEFAAEGDSLINQLPDPSPNINKDMPTFEIPKFTDVVDIPEVDDFGNLL